jgi:hypothetical protein
MGGFAPPRFPGKEKRNPKKEKPRSKNKKDTAEKKNACSCDTALTAWIDRQLAAFG